MSFYIPNKDCNFIPYYFNYGEIKSFSILISYLFSAHTDVCYCVTDMDLNLGTEIELTPLYKISKCITLNTEHSKIFFTECMEVLLQILVYKKINQKQSNYAI